MRTAGMTGAASGWSAPNKERFGAKPLATYQLPRRWPQWLSFMPSSHHNVTLYELEPDDAPAIERLNAYVGEQRRNEPDFHRSRSWTFLQQGLQTYLRPKQLPMEPDKHVGFLAMRGNQVLGFLVGHLNKESPILGKILPLLGQASQQAAQPPDAEADWVISFGRKAEPQLKGVGQVLMSEFYRWCEEQGVRNIFLTSVAKTPEKPQMPLRFYEQVGMTRVLDKGNPSFEGLNNHSKLLLRLRAWVYGWPLTLERLMHTTSEQARADADRIEARFTCQPLQVPSVPLPF